MNNITYQEQLRISQELQKKVSYQSYALIGLVLLLIGFSLDHYIRVSSESSIEEKIQDFKVENNNALKLCIEDRADFVAEHSFRGRLTQEDTESLRYFEVEIEERTCHN
jgi:hypothetical protein